MGRKIAWSEAEMSEQENRELEEEQGGEEFGELIGEEPGSGLNGLLPKSNKNWK